MILQPKAWSLFATSWPMLPKPTIPTRLLHNWNYQSLTLNRNRERSIVTSDFSNGDVILAQAQHFNIRTVVIGDKCQS